MAKAKKEKSSIKEIVKETEAASSEIIDTTGLKAWFVNLGTLEKIEADPKGVMLIVKTKRHEIGIQADTSKQNLIFSYYPPQDKNKLTDVTISIKQIIDFIKQNSAH